MKFLVLRLEIWRNYLKNCLSTYRLPATGLNNEFFARACESWRCRLSAGEFTHDNQMKLKVDAEKERSKLDPWKVIKQLYLTILSIKCTLIST